MVRTKNLKRSREREGNQEVPVENSVETERNEELETERNDEVGEQAVNPDPVEIGEDGGGEIEEEEKEEEEKEDEEEAIKDKEGEKVNEENENDKENENDEEGASPSRTVSDPLHAGAPIDPIDLPIESEEEMEALQPMRMYFPTTEYPKKIKISTRCFINDVLKTFKDLPHPLTPKEKKWFEEQPQFKHIFHMPVAKNHMVMGIWLLLLRTACIDRRKEAWFVVNGVPIRYGINEHALISGLNCCNYPLGYEEFGSEAFVRKHISRKVIRLQDVKEKLVEMAPSRDRLKMAVLFFLASIIRGQTKSGKDGTGVEPILLRAVGDLKYCSKFPWGRLSFDHMLKEISHTMSHFGGVVKGGIWPIPGFCIPLEHLAFEAIPQLHSAFREDVPEADTKCPRMCKSRFKETYLRGFPLSEIYEQLGTTRDIESIITVREEENNLMSNIVEEEEDVDVHDVVVNSWMSRLSRGNPVSFEEMYQADVDSRVAQANEDVGNEAMGSMGELVDLVNVMRADMDARFTTIEEMFEEKFVGLEKRIAPLEEFVKKEKALQGNLMDVSDEDGDEDGVQKSPQPRDDDGQNSPQPRDDDGQNSPQPRDDDGQDSDEENLGVVIAKKRSEIQSAKKRSREPKSYPRRPLTRSLKPRVD